MHGNIPTRPYRPPNGTSGEDFMAAYCDRCKRDEKYRETQNGEDSCQILAATMIYDVSDNEYPTEWIVNIGDPFGATARCTAFEKTED